MYAIGKLVATIIAVSTGNTKAPIINVSPSVTSSPPQPMVTVPQSQFGGGTSAATYCSNAYPLDDGRYPLRSACNGYVVSDLPAGGTGCLGVFANAPYGELTYKTTTDVALCQNDCERLMFNNPQIYDFAKPTDVAGTPIRMVATNFASTTHIVKAMISNPGLFAPGNTSRQRRALSITKHTGTELDQKNRRLSAYSGSGTADMEFYWSKCMWTQDSDLVPACTRCTQADVVGNYCTNTNKYTIRSEWDTFYNLESCNVQITSDMGSLWQPCRSGSADMRCIAGTETLTKVSNFYACRTLTSTDRLQVVSNSLSGSYAAV